MVFVAAFELLVIDLVGRSELGVGVQVLHGFHPVLFGLEIGAVLPLADHGFGMFVAVVNQLHQGYHDQEYFFLVNKLNITQVFLSDLFVFINVD